MNNKVNLNKVIFKFESLKGNQCFKLVTKTLDGETGEILEGGTLIAEHQAKELSQRFDIPVVDLVFNEEEGKYIKLEDLEEE